MRPLNIVLVVTLAIYLTACSDRHPAYSEYDFAIPMSVRPSDSLLAGEYELDEFSYSLVDEAKAYPNTPILLTISANGSLQFTNLPDMAISTTGKPVKRQLFNGIGSWSVPADAPFSGSKVFIPFSGYIVFRFKAGGLFPTPTTLSYQLRFRDNQPVIWIPVGSPNTNQKLLFVKKALP